MTAETKALARNTDALLVENDKLTQANKDLLDRIAIIESEVKSEREHSKNLTEENKTLKREVADLKTKNQELFERNTVLLKFKDQLAEIQAIYTKLSSMPRTNPKPSSGKYFDSELEAECEAQNRLIFGKTWHESLLVPNHLQPLTDSVKKSLNKT